MPKFRTRLFIFLTFLISISLLEVSSELPHFDQKSFKQEKPRLCLTMIVKNESKIIERCLNSVKDVVDCVSISDTGSTDNTIEIIENFLKKNKIPGKVHRHAWKNFGFNRSLSAKAAQETLLELKFPLLTTYLLLLDADMLLEVKKDFDKNKLLADSYLLEQKNNSIAYYNTRLIRASMPWECIGVTHEYWSCRVPNQTMDQITTLKIDDREDGGCKDDKFERDVRLLKQGILDEPGNERYMFYLGQSYRCLRQYQDAIKWYKNRIEKGGWIEEVWYSKCMIGEMYEEMGCWDQALAWYLEAYETVPQRSESLYKIATHYRQKGDNHLAYLFANQGSRIPYPKDFLLFVSYPVYDYQFDEEISIAGYYTPYKNEGFSAANRLIFNKNTPPHIKETTYKNFLFYVENLKIAKQIPIEIELPPLFENSNEKYNPMNPSIKKTKEGYNLICRTVNYTQEKGNNYRSRDPHDPTVRTKNFLVAYDPSFKMMGQREIIENIPRERYPSSVLGLEDCRLIESDRYHWIFSTTFDTHAGTVGQTLCRIENNSDAKRALLVEKFIPLQGPEPGRCEKNWLPFVRNGELLAIYGYDPLTILKIDRETGACEVLSKKESKHDFSKFRGSAPPIEFDSGYLLLVHEVVFTDQRTYLHRFVYLDSDLNITKVSKPFTFLHKGIEYCCGMTMDGDQKQCILSVGIDDKEARLLFVDCSHIQNILEEIK